MSAQAETSPSGTGADLYLETFQQLLRELFQFDCQDLDFGIYRLLNFKRQQVEDFIGKRLPQIIKSALAQYATADQKTAEQELEQKRQEIVLTLGPNAFDAAGQLSSAFRDTPMGKQFVELKQKVLAGQLADQLEAGIYNDLHTFFARYYDDGDIFSKPRRGKVEIPFTGDEDVVLNWANQGQYYIKTGEWFNSYRFKTQDATVEFVLCNASAEQNNNRSENRYFILTKDPAVTFDEKTSTLIAFLEYRTFSDKERKTYGKTEGQKPQENVNAATEKAVLNQIKNLSVKAHLAQPVGEGRPSLLLYHLMRFTRKNTTDFFIHKNLRGFLARELDDFLKTEVLRNDELLSVDHPDVPRRALLRAQVVRRVAQDIIDFLGQVEEFQKRLFEKRKFIVQSEYCLTIDRVPEKLWSAVLKNASQLKEWSESYGLDDLLKHSKEEKPDYSFFKSHGNFVIDTRHFDDNFKKQLLSSFDDIESELGGLLIKSENFQALAILHAKYKGRVKCIYIDPPYNTGADDFVYRDHYRHSCWASMMLDRLSFARDLLHSSGTIGISIDTNELDNLLKLLDAVFGPENRRNIITVKRASVTGPKVINPGVVNVTEFLAIYSKDKLSWKPNKIYRAKERDVRYSTFIKNRDQLPTKWEFTSLLRAFSESKGLSPKELKKSLGDDFENALDKFAIENAEAVAQIVPLDEAKRSKDAIDLKKKSESQPETIFVLKREGFDDLYLIGGKRILFYSDRIVTIGDQKVQGELLTDIWDDTLPNDLHNEGGVELKKGKKPEKLVGRLIELASGDGELVLDFFVGSGTACAAAQKLKRKWIGVEMETWFDTKTLPRLKNTLFGDQSGLSPVTGWKGGGFFAWTTLEQYEDTLNNLALTKDKEGQLAFATFSDEYLLRYMLDFETQSSASLLDIERLARPFAYKLRIQDREGIVERSVDLVETFNAHLGLTVRKAREFDDGSRLYRAVLGETPVGKRAVVVWRDIEGLADNAQALQVDREFIEGKVLPQLLGTQTKPDRLWINGASTVAGSEPIEAEFHRLMFAPLGQS